jgi:hypothetical protein
MNINIVGRASVKKTVLPYALFKAAEGPCSTAVLQFL